MERVRKSIFPPGPLSPIRHLSSVMEFSARKGKQIVILKLGTFFYDLFHDVLITQSSDAY